MNRISLAVAALLAVAAALGGAWWVLSRGGPEPSSSSSASASGQQALQPFHQIVLEGNAAVTLVQGAAEAIAIDVTGNSTVHAEVRDGVLAIRAGDDRRWWSFLLGGARSRSPQITVTFRNIDSVRGSGSVKLAGDHISADILALRFSGAAAVKLGSLQARSITVSGSGAFKAELAGRVDEQRISISGAGEYRGGELASDHATISVSGAGRVIVNASRTLDVDLSGAAKVDYIGDPKITQRVSGAGRIRRQDRAEHSFWLATASPHGINAIPAESCRA